MNMLNRKRWRKALEKQEKTSSLSQWVSAEFAKVEYTLSDQYCRFDIVPAVVERGDSIIVQMYLIPQQGIFADIEFRPKMFLNAHTLAYRPVFYNDRRVFHPNINVYTCEIVFPELVQEWAPTNDLIPLLRHLKYTFLKPNTNFVPNNFYNRKAAWDYHYNLGRYRQIIMQNCPKYLEGVIYGEITRNNESNMDIQREAGERGREQVGEDEYWSLQRLNNKKKRTAEEESAQWLQESETIDLLTKKIKLLDFEPHISEETETFL